MSIPASRCETHVVRGVQFGVLSERRIKETAVCAITVPKTVLNGRPVRGGLSDLRLGSLDFRTNCETCGMAHPWCVGHFGYLELAEPMYNVGTYDVVARVITSVCEACGALLMQDPEEFLSHPSSGPNRLRVVADQAKSGRCPRGHKDRRHITRLRGQYPGLVLIAELDGDREILTSAYVRGVLDKISDDHARIMGFAPEHCHPRDLILTVLPVPPPHVRPSVSFGSRTSENELTSKLLSIMRQNERLSQELQGMAPSSKLDETRMLLQAHIATYFNNASTYYKPSMVSERSKTSLKSIYERLKGKYGRLRGNLMGKRVDFSARTVITGDPNIDVDEVGVPFSVAMTMTIPERVNAMNIKRLQETVRRVGYPGANYVIHANGTKTALDRIRNRSTYTLEIGDTVERHLLNGDVVLFNRQPTLHRMSMMGHRVRVLSFNTFRLNLSCTTPYNADFDGDEMNLHVPQSLLTKAEMIEMMMVPKNFVSPNKSSPCMGIVQDSLLGCYRLTDKETFLDKAFMQNVALWLDVAQLPVPAILLPTPLWTGKQLFSMILPTINIHGESKSNFPKEDDVLLIRDGKLLCGQINKGIVGVAPGSLIHLLFNDRGSDAVAAVINGIQRITTQFLIHHSFSVGVQDTVVDSSTLQTIDDILRIMRQNVQGVAAKANLQQLARKSGMTLLQSFESYVNEFLNRALEEASTATLNSVRRTNSFRSMIKAGSKGSETNICQITVMVGQQNLNGARIPFGFRRRTLPHFMQDDYGESSRGMVNRGYFEGLKPYEFFFHMMGGRDGLIDTAVKTADTGYLQRKLIKALEDVHVAYDGTVRNANNEVVQLLYGEDGLDGARIEAGQKVDLWRLSNADMQKQYHFEYSESHGVEGLGGSYMNPLMRRRLMAVPDNLFELQQEYERLLQGRDQLRSYMDISENVTFALPVNLRRVVDHAIAATRAAPESTSSVNPLSVIEKTEQLVKSIHRLIPANTRQPDGSITNVVSAERVANSMRIFTIYLRSMLASKKVLQDYRLSERTFDFLVGEIFSKFQQAIVQPGEMVGAMAAQSCGEPATQMTLNTFHSAGISSKNVTLGVPRLLELLNVSSHQRNTAMLVYLADHWGTQLAEAQQALHILEYASLESLTNQYQIIYDPDPFVTVTPEDQHILDLAWSTTGDDEHEMMVQRLSSASPWVVRLELDGAKFRDKSLSMPDVVREVREYCERSLAGGTERYIIQSSHDAKSDTRIMRFRLMNDQGPDTVPLLKAEIPQLLTGVHLAGVPGVKKVFVKDVKEYPIDPVTGVIASPPRVVYTLDTEGTALKSIFAGVYDRSVRNIVDFRRTSSDTVPEVLSVLGIEAARRKLYNEMFKAYNAYGLKINYRHYAVLVDTISHRGKLMAVSRVGINRSDAGPLMCSSFEETVKILMQAAAFAERDNARGVSASIMFGKQAPAGTGLFELLLDTNALRSAAKQSDATAPTMTANVYHTQSSVAAMMPSEGPPRPGATPMAVERSVNYASASGSWGEGSSPILVSSAPQPSPRPITAAMFSGAHSVLNSASQYNPVSPSEGFESAPSTEGQGMLFNLLSSANPFRFSAATATSRTTTHPSSGVGGGSRGSADVVGPYNPSAHPMSTTIAGTSASYLPVTSPMHSQRTSALYRSASYSEASRPHDVSPEYIPVTPATTSTWAHSTAAHSTTAASSATFRSRDLSPHDEERDETPPPT